MSSLLTFFRFTSTFSTGSWTWSSPPPSSLCSTVLSTGEKNTTSHENLAEHSKVSEHQNLTVLNNSKFVDAPILRLWNHEMFGREVSDALRSRTVVNQFQLCIFFSAELFVWTNLTGRSYGGMAGARRSPCGRGTSASRGSPSSSCACSSAATSPGSYPTSWSSSKTGCRRYYFCLLSIIYLWDCMSVQYNAENRSRAACLQTGIREKRNNPNNVVSTKELRDSFPCETR